MNDRAEARLPRPKSNLRTIALGGAVLATVGASASPAAHGSSRLDPTERRVIRLINKNRAFFNLPAVRASRALSRSAEFHSGDMLRRNFFAHASSSGTPFDRRVRRFKRAVSVGENLAYVPGRRGGRSARRIVSMWLNSPQHRAVILDRSFRRIGVARRSGSFGRGRVTVFTADFSSGR